MAINTKLYLDTSQFDKSFLKAKKDIEDFKGKISSAGAGLMKFAGFLGAGYSALEMFNKAVNSSQTLGDAYRVRMEQMKTVTDELFYAIANGDFSSLDNGLKNTIKLARQAAEALDQLGNTTMSYGYSSSKYQAEFSEQIAVLSDKSASESDKSAAKKAAEEIIKKQEEITNTLAKDSETAVQAIVKKFAGQNTEAFTPSIETIEKMIQLDATSGRSKEKAELKTRYEEFVKKAALIADRNTTTSTAIIGDQAILQKNLNREGYNKDIAPLLKQYEEAITYNSVLNKQSDQQLQDLMNINMAAFQAQRSLESMRKTLYRKEKAPEVSVATGSKKETAAPVAGSIAELSAKIKELQTAYENAADDGTRIGFAKAIEEAKKKLERIEFAANIKPVESPKFDDETEGIGDKLQETLTDKVPGVQVPLELEDTEKLKYLRENFLSLNEPLENLQAGLDGAGEVMGKFGGKAGQIGQATLGIISKLIVGKQAEAIASGISSAMSLPFPANLAAAAGVIGTIASLFAMIPKFETGGFVPGTSYSGDKTLIRANAGELILNRAQQSNLATQLGTRSVNVSVSGRISGRDIELVMDKREKFLSR